MYCKYVLWMMNEHGINKYYTVQMFVVNNTTECNDKSAMTSLQSSLVYYTSVCVWLFLYA